MTEAGRTVADALVVDRGFNRVVVPVRPRTCRGAASPSASVFRRRAFTPGASARRAFHRWGDLCHAGGGVDRPAEPRDPRDVAPAAARLVCFGKIGGGMVGALDDVLVVDLTRILTGPYCTMMLADMGARVVKVEPPGGDDTRRWGPPFVHGESAYFLSVNRNKESVVLDLKTHAGREALLTLVRHADVLVENFRPGTMDRLDLAYARLQAINPRLVMASISGFGASGPGADRPGYDVLAQAMGGLMAVTGEPDGPPLKAGFSVADIGAGMWAAFAILAALYARERTGRGQWIDTSLYEAVISWQTYQAGNYFATGENPRRLGTAHPNIAPYQALRCRDGHLVVACGNDQLWQRMVEALGITWGDDPRYRTNPDRVQHRDSLIAALEDHLAHWTVQEAWAALAAVGVPAGPIQSFEEIYRDPHVLQREMMVTVDHPTAGPVRMTGIPVKLSDTPGSVRTPPPLLGQHTDRVLREFGINPEGGSADGLPPASS
jgi:crotonobetainyl-CoA:carnitine CoA-transferase CaiB-like acyl-CoA transferase